MNINEFLTIDEQAEYALTQKEDVFFKAFKDSKKMEKYYTSFTLVCKEHQVVLFEMIRELIKVYWGDVEDPFELLLEDGELNIEVKEEYDSKDPYDSYWDSFGSDLRHAAFAFFSGKYSFFTDATNAYEKHLHEVGTREGMLFLYFRDEIIEYVKDQMIFSLLSKNKSID